MPRASWAPVLPPVCAYVTESRPQAALQLASSAALSPRLAAEHLNLRWPCDSMMQLALIAAAHCRLSIHTARRQDRVPLSCQLFRGASGCERSCIAGQMKPSLTSLVGGLARLSMGWSCRGAVSHATRSVNRHCRSQQQLDR